MSRKKDKKVIEIVKDEKEPIVVVPVSEKKAKFKALIEAYKIQNPAKYELKKEALQEKLNNIK